MHKLYRHRWPSRRVVRGLAFAAHVSTRSALRVCVLGCFMFTANGVTATALTPPPPSPAADAPVDAYEGGPQSDTPRPLKRSRVAAVLTVNAGLSAQPNTAAACQRFQPRPADVSQYFARAQPVSWNAYLQQGDWSPCSAQGELRLKDGRLAQWRIQSFGLASLRIDGANHYFSCTQRCRITRLPPGAAELGQARASKPPQR